MKIGFITSATDKLSYYFPTQAEPDFIPLEPPFTPDDHLVVTALRKRGHVVNAIVWNTPVATLVNYDFIVVRSPWDYMDSEDSKTQFMNWMSALEQAGLTVSNPAAFMRWMLDKHYLADLEKQQVSVIPTQYFEKGEALDLQKQFHAQGSFVLKPCVSAAGIGLYHIKNQDDAIALQNEIYFAMQDNSYMLQEVIEDIHTNGEWSLIFLGGEYSHALHKMPAANSIMVHAERGGSLSFDREAPAHVIDFARHVCKNLLPAFNHATKKTFNEKHILYLRLDIIDTKIGPVLIECEGVEPELFFRAKPLSEIKFCEALETHSA